jgi:TolB-like protein
MKPQRLFVITLCIIFCSDAFGQVQDMDKELSDLATKLATSIKDNGKKKVTVLDFTDLQGGSSELGKYIAEELTVDLVMVKKDFSVLDRANLRKILAEHKLTATGLVDPENAKKLGMFAGVDALILGTVTPKNQKINLTAKIITTDTAEIVGAAKTEFKSDESVQQLLAQPAKAEDTTGASEPASTSTPPSPKPFGDLQIKVESLKVTPSGYYMLGTLTLIITNASASQTLGVAIETTIDGKFNLSNSRGDEFHAYEVTGIEKTYDQGTGIYQDILTDIPPRSSIMIVSKSQCRGDGNLGDYRPYRLQTLMIWGVEDKGRHPNLKKYNLVMDIK